MASYTSQKALKRFKLKFEPKRKHPPHTYKLRRYKISLWTSGHMAEETQGTNSLI